MFNSTTRVDFMQSVPLTAGYFKNSTGNLPGVDINSVGTGTMFKVCVEPQSPLFDDRVYAFWSPMGRFVFDINIAVTVATVGTLRIW